MTRGQSQHRPPRTTEGQARDRGSVAGERAEKGKPRQQRLALGKPAGVTGTGLRTGVP